MPSSSRKGRHRSDFRGVLFAEGQGHGIEKHGADVEKVTVEKTGQQQCGNGNCNVFILQRRFCHCQANGLNAVERIGRKPDDAAGGDDLDGGIVPTGGEEGGECVNR